MMDRKIWLLGCLAMLTSLFAGAPCSAEEDQAFELRGVIPGVTTRQALDANTRWGRPISVKRLPNGEERRSYELRGYSGVQVLLHGNLVQTIDVTLPDKLPADTAATLLQLGDPQPDLKLPESAAVGSAVDKNWQSVPHSAGRLTLYVDPTTKLARSLRIYADRLLPLTDSRPAPPAPGNEAPAEASKLAGTTPHQRQALLTSIALLGSEHYAQHPMDELIASRTLGNVIETLDPYKMFFRHGDIARFRQQESEFAAELKEGDASLIYDIVRTRQERTREMIEMALELAAEEHDFTVDETLIMDKDDAVYLENDLEAREVWRKRVKGELLTHLSAGLSMGEARRRTVQYLLNQRISWDGQDDQALHDMLIGQLGAAYDGHCLYYGPKRQEEFLVNMQRKLVGIGLSGSMAGSYYTVQRVVPGGPADKDGRLQVGDRVIAVGETPDSEMIDIIGKPIAEVVQLMRGEKDVPVRLRVLRTGEFESQLYTINRDEVNLARLGGMVFTSQELPKGRTARVGLIDMPMFYTDWEAARAGKKDYRSVVSDVAKILQDFREEKVDVVMLDLRNNGGGSLRTAIDFCGLFIGSGVVTQSKSANGKISPMSVEGQQQVWSGPLVVLTSKVTAGGAETVAAAMRDYHRALIIGDERTNGFGTSQSMINIGQVVFKTPDAPRLGLLRVTTNRLFSPSGDSMQLVGVPAHVSIATELTGSSYGEAEHKYYLSRDKVAAAKYEPLKYPISAKLQERLQAATNSRQANTEHFQQLALARTSKPYNASRREMSLNKEKYLASLKSQKNELPQLSGIPGESFTPWLQEALVVTLDYLSELQYQEGEALYGEREYAAGVAAYRRAVAADPNNINAQFKLAWSLATCPVAAVRNGQAAVASATALCELDKRQTWNYVLTLAIAEAEAGDFENARKHLAEALQEAPAAQRAVYGYLEQRFKNGQAFQ